LRRQPNRRRHLYLALTPARPAGMLCTTIYREGILKTPLMNAIRFYVDQRALLENRESETRHAQPHRGDPHVSSRLLSPPIRPHPPGALMNFIVAAAELRQIKGLRGLLSYNQDYRKTRRITAVKENHY
jgi:hypothetical protein